MHQSFLLNVSFISSLSSCINRLFICIVLFALCMSTIHDIIMLLPVKFLLSVFSFVYLQFLVFNI